MKCDQLIEMRKCPLKVDSTNLTTQTFRRKIIRDRKKDFQLKQSSALSLLHRNIVLSELLVCVKINTNSCKLLFLIGFTTRHANF